MWLKSKTNVTFILSCDWMISIILSVKNYEEKIHTKAISGLYKVYNET